MKFSHLSTTSDAESDQRRSYLPRLRCVLRFSQPLDALFRPHPFGLVSCRYHPGFHLQSFPLTLASRASRHPLPLLLSPVMSKGHIGPTPGIHAIARSVPFRSVLPKNRRPFLSWCSPLRGFPRSVSTSLKTSPLMGFNMTLPSNRSSRSSSCLLCRVSKNREVDELFRAQLPPWGFQSSAPAKAGALRTPSGNALSR